MGNIGDKISSNFVAAEGVAQFDNKLLLLKAFTLLKKKITTKLLLLEKILGKWRTEMLEMLFHDLW